MFSILLHKKLPKLALLLLDFFSNPLLIAFSVWTRLDRECGWQQNPMVVDAEVHALIYESSSEGGSAIYWDGSVVCYVCSWWANMAQVGGKMVREYSNGFALTMSNLTMRS